MFVASELSAYLVSIVAGVQFLNNLLGAAYKDRYRVAPLDPGRR